MCALEFGLGMPPISHLTEKDVFFRQFYGYQESGGGGGPPPGSGAAGGGPGVVDYQPPPPPPGEYPLPPYYGGYPPPPHPPPPPPNPAYLHSQGRPFVDREYRGIAERSEDGPGRGEGRHKTRTHSGIANDFCSPPLPALVLRPDTCTCFVCVLRFNPFPLRFFFFLFLCPQPFRVAHARCNRVQKTWILGPLLVMVRERQWYRGPVCHCHPVHW